MWLKINASGTSESLAVPFRYLSEPHKFRIWDGNLLRITILMKFPIPLFFFFFFWQNLKFRGNGSCRKTSVWCWPAPGRRVAQQRKTKPVWLHVFTPLKRFGFGSNQERAFEVFILCQFLQIPFTWIMELCASGGNKPSTIINHLLISQSHINQPFVIPNMTFTPVAFTLSILGSLHQPSHLQIYKVSKCSWLRTFSSTGLILGC